MILNTSDILHPTDITGSIANTNNLSKRQSKGVKNR